MTRAPVLWYWSDVDATRIAGGTRLTHRVTSVQLDVTGGRLAGGSGYADASPATRRTLARVGAMVRLREKGRFLVHASGAVDPQGRGWLLSGEGGAGKSTLAYALVRAGWTVLGDDGVLIERNKAGITAYPWKDPVQVSSALALAFPELREHAARVSRGDARQRIPMHAALATPAPVSAIIFVERANACTVTRVGALETLAALVRQSPWVMLGDVHSRDHLDALRRASALPCFRLRHTPAELHTVARVITDALLA